MLKNLINFKTDLSRASTGAGWSRSRTESEKEVVGERDIVEGEGEEMDPVAEMAL
tara:strand:- start:1164 stop:1328 length:165 start_codon:yes stop_codon:yes gene_type:complete